MEISKIPIQELLNDRLESINDIKVCELALLHGIEKCSGGSVQERLDVNRQYIIKIDEELKRREVVIR